MERHACERGAMIREQLQHRGLTDKRVIAAMRTVPRHLFVPKDQQSNAYRDSPLPIGHGQTISQPYIVALMAEALELTENCTCLDVGTGSGYAAAVLAQICKNIIGIERVPGLAELARQNLSKAGVQNVEVTCGDGSLGYPDCAPYDAIAVAAGAPVAPEPLKAQLKTGGRLVIPVGPSARFQELLLIRKRAEDDFETQTLGSVAFVPLIGTQAWPEA